MIRFVDDQEEISLGDVGFDLDLGDMDLSFDLISEEKQEEIERYVVPKAQAMKTAHIVYANAEKLAQKIKLEKGMRYDVICAGNFIFGDFLEAFLVLNDCKAKKVDITTLSMSLDNVASLRDLMIHGYIDELNLCVSAYFYGHERHGLIPAIYNNLDIDNRFQLAVAGVHTKTICILTERGEKICIHGSANLRSSASVEFFTIEENADTYDFYAGFSDFLSSEYPTIKKDVPQALKPNGSVKIDQRFTAVQRNRAGALWRQIEAKMKGGVK